MKKLNQNLIGNILVLEDSSERIEWFYKIFEDKFNIFCTDDVDEAILLIKSYEFSIIFLDRDLGEGKKAGEDFTSAMLQEKMCKNSLVVLHSVNPYGVQKMENDLKKYHKNFQVLNFFFFF